MFTRKPRLQPENFDLRCKKTFATQSANTGSGQFRLGKQRDVAAGITEAELPVVITKDTATCILAGKLVSDGERRTVSLQRPRYDHTPSLHFRLNRLCSTSTSSCARRWG